MSSKRLYGYQRDRTETSDEVTSNSFTPLIQPRMKREWFDESFNKEKMEQEDATGTTISTVYQNYMEKRSKFWMNVVEFIVWVLLLWVCGRYLSNHPAERISLFSWVEVFVDKTKLFLWWSEWTSEELERKRQLISLYDELLDIGAWSDCLSAEDIENIESTKTTIEAKDIEEFVQREQSYNAVARIFMSKVANWCE